MWKFSRVSPSRIAALDRLARREADRVHEDVEPVPVLAQLGEAGIDLRVFGDVQRDHDVRAVFRGGVLDARLQLVALVGEGEFRTLAAHGLGDAVGDRALAGDAGDECTLALQESHGVLAE